MSHPTKSEVEKAVKLWRCGDAGYETYGKMYRSHHERSPECDINNCVIVGFRLPPRCEDCEHAEEPTFPCPACRNNGMKNYTPRQAGKGNV